MAKTVKRKRAKNSTKHYTVFATPAAAIPATEPENEIADLAARIANLRLEVKTAKERVAEAEALEHGISQELSSTMKQFQERVEAFVKL